MAPIKPTGSDTRAPRDKLFFTSSFPIIGHPRDARLGDAAEFLASRRAAPRRDKVRMRSNSGQQVEAGPQGREGERGETEGRRARWGLAPRAPARFSSRERSHVRLR